MHLLLNYLLDAIIYAHERNIPVQQLKAVIHVYTACSARSKQTCDVPELALLIPLSTVVGVNNCHEQAIGTDPWLMSVTDISMVYT